MNQPSKLFVSTKGEFFLLSLLTLEFLTTFFLPGDRLKWFLKLGSYSVVVIFALIVGELLIARSLKPNFSFKEVLRRSLQIENIFLSVTVLLITINVITLQPSFEAIETTPILFQYYILLYYLFLGFLLIVSAFDVDSLVKGVVSLVLFSFVTYSLPFEVHFLGYLPHAGILIFLIFKLLKKEDVWKQGVFGFPLDPIVVLLFISCLISTIFAFFPQESLEAFVKYSTYFLTYFVVSRVLHRNDVRKSLLILFLLFSLFLSSLFIYKISINSIAYNFSVALMFKMWLSQIHPNAIVIYAIMILSLSLGLFFCSRSKSLKLLLSLVIPSLLFLILLTYSKTGYLALVICVIVIFYHHSDMLKKGIRGLFKFRVWKALSIIIFLVFMVLVFPKIKLRVQSRFLKSDYLSERLLYWELGSRIIREHPFAGTGLRSYYLLSKYLEPTRYKDAILLRKLFLGGTLGSHLHNSYVELGASCGIFGFFAFLWLLFLMIKLMVSFAGFRSGDSLADGLYIGSMAGSIALMVGALFDHLLEFFGIGVLFFAALGIVSSYCYWAEKGSPSTKRGVEKKGVIKGVLYSIVIFYFLIITSWSSASILFERGKNALNNSYPTWRGYFRVLNLIDPLNWRYYDFLFHKRLQLAYRSYTSFDLDECFNDLKISVEKNPHFAPGYRKLGYLYWIFGDLKMAEKCFEIALKLDPAGGFWDQHFSDLALIESSLSNHERAFYLMKEAVKLNPLTVNADFWIVRNKDDSSPQKILNPLFVLKDPDKYDRILFKRRLMHKIMSYDKGATRPVQAIENRSILDDKYFKTKIKLSLGDILGSIYDDYLALKSENSTESRTILISLVSAYYHLGNKEMVNKLMVEEGLDYIPAINTRGMMIPRINPFELVKEKEIQLVPEP